MSERGSFVTEYIYCSKCLNVAKKILLSNDKYLCSRQLPSWEKKGKKLPIISGKIGGLFQNEELITFQDELKPKLDAELCHVTRIVVLPDAGGAYLFKVGGEKHEPA